MKERWEVYFSELLDGESESGQRQMVKEDDKEITEPKREEVEPIIGCMKSNKSLRQNGITNENIKYAGEELKKRFKNC